MAAPSTPNPPNLHEKVKSGHIPNVYDAVAGRVAVSTTTTTTQTDDTPATPKSSPRDRLASAHDIRLAPEDVLWRRKGAPTRYAEYDIYWANEELEEGQLPDSDLLKAIHGYASRFYAATAKRTQAGQVIDERSMDETALLAFAVLLEEAGREAIGARGDLVFTEGEVDDVEDDGRQRKRRKIEDKGETREGDNKEEENDADDESEG